MKTTQTLRFGIDPHNRLIYKNPPFRNILDGTFSVENNSLVYRVKTPAGGAVPQQVRLSGKWSLNKEHDLVLTLDKERGQSQSDTLTLQGEIVDAAASALVFSLATQDTDGTQHLYLMRVAGRWQADRYNQLNFLISKENGLTDTLVFRGA